MRLQIPRGDAVNHLSKLIEDGQAIRGQRIRSSATLDSARELKAQWSQRALDIINQMFSDSSIAEETLAWVGKILPEYAHFGAFVESFHEEMDNHLKNLAGLKKLIERKPLPTVKETPTIAEAIAMVPPMPATPDMDEEIAAAVTETVKPPFESAPQGRGQAPMAASSNGNGHARHATPPTPKPVAAPAAVNPAKGLLIMHGGDAASATASLRDFVQTLGLVLICADASGPDHKGAISALEGHEDFDFALLLSDTPAPPMPEADEDAPHGISMNEPASLSFELGYCVGRLGLNRVCALHPHSSEPFTDGHGILHLPLDAGGGWQLALARHFRRSGLNLDLNKLC